MKIIPTQILSYSYKLFHFFIPFFLYRCHGSSAPLGTLPSLSWGYFDAGQNWSSAIFWSAWNNFYPKFESHSRTVSFLGLVHTCRQNPWLSVDKSPILPVDCCGTNPTWSETFYHESTPATCLWTIAELCQWTQVACTKPYTSSSIAPPCFSTNFM